MTSENWARLWGTMVEWWCLRTYSEPIAIKLGEETLTGERGYEGTRLRAHWRNIINTCSRDWRHRMGAEEYVKTQNELILSKEFQSVPGILHRNGTGILEKDCAGAGNGYHHKKRPQILFPTWGNDRCVLLSVVPRYQGTGWAPILFSLFNNGRERIHMLLERRGAAQRQAEEKERWTAH